MKNQAPVYIIRPDVVSVAVASVPILLILLIASVLLNVYAAHLALVGWGVVALYAIWRSLKIVAVRFAAKYEVYSDSVVASVGVVSRHVSRVRIADIRGMAVNQSLWGRLLGVGDVVVGTAATGGAEVVMRGVRDPSAVVAAIEELRGPA
jgi:uncharacterized membrane protein YdbT with pleckstrin-like domain